MKKIASSTAAAKVINVEDSANLQSLLDFVFQWTNLEELEDLEDF